jgi:transposase InsO family protein
MERLSRQRQEELHLLLLIQDIREDHPTMGIRDMYYKLGPMSMGRDRFEYFCKAESLLVTRPKNYRRTTDSYGVVRFNNLLENLEINKINQVWQSDITYFDLAGKFYYITFIIDGFSRRIIGHSTSRRLFTEDTTLPALQMAIKLRKQQKLSIRGVIFHSDGGGQYYDRNFLLLTNKCGIQNSMCKYAWENGKAERINGVIKNNYLKHRTIKNIEQLVIEVDRSVLLYNKEKPHIALQRTTPESFEKYYLCNGQQSDGEKSATEVMPWLPEGSALRAEDNNPSGSISLKK